MRVMVNKHRLFWVFILWAGISMVAAANGFAPVKLNSNLDGMKLSIEASLIDELAMVELTNKDTATASCSVIFHNGPEAETIRQTSLAPGKRKLLSTTFRRDVISVRIYVNCKKHGL